MTPREISAPPEISVGTHLHAQNAHMRSKTTQIFLPADGKAYWLLLPSSVSLPSGSTVQPKKNLFRYPHGDR